MKSQKPPLDSQEFSGKTVIVTGGGYGIGKQIALSFGKLGANVVVAARSRDKLEQVADQLRGLNTDPLALTVDIGQEKAVRDMVDAVLDKYGGIDVLVNNAAISGPTAMIPDVDTDDWREAVDINLSGTFYCCRYVSKDIPIGRMPSEQEVANSVVFLASDLSMGIHGQTIQVDGGYRMG